jgi:hypothetical protein
MIVKPGIKWSCATATEYDRKAGVKWSGTEK